MSQFLGGLDARMSNWGWTILDESWHIRAGRVDMSHRRRGESEFGARFRWFTLWPSSAQMSGDLSAGYSQLGQDAANTGKWSPTQRMMRGNGALKYIMGYCKDAAGVAVSGATVTGFLTGSDLPVGETACDATGYYELGTPYPNTNHYLVAYRAGAPDIAGTTVNTLQPTNRDGS